MTRPARPGERVRRPWLRRLAEALGIERVWRDATGFVRRAGDDTLARLCAAFGYPASDERRARRSLESLEERLRALPAPPQRFGRAPWPEEVGAARAFGVWTNLYSVRSERHLGVGNAADLERLLERVAAAGGAFVGTNPLHHHRARRDECSPYGPMSRRYVTPLFVDVRRVPEFRRCAEARRLLEAAERDGTVRRLREGAWIDWEGTRDLADRLLRALYASFRREVVRRADGPRARAYRRFLEREGEALEGHARFLAIDAWFRRREGPGAWWRTWPAGYAGPRDEGVEAFVAAHPDEVDYHRFVQFEADRQLAELSGKARALGLPIGLYTDLAVGSLPDGSDVWADRQAYVLGASLAAPPDAFARTGQVWGLPPLHPLVLIERGGEPFRSFVRAALRHAGALRVDHAIGLVRPYVVPAGRSARHGAPVRFPAGVLFSVLVEEARRAGALVVGEDLGTVPPGLRPRMTRRGVLRSAVYLFARTRDGGFRTPRGLPRRALLTTTTHDHAPMPGFATGADLELRARLQRWTKAALARALSRRRREVRRLVERLERTLGRPVGESPEAVVSALHEMLARAPCDLFALSLDDLAGETLPINVPGVPLTVHPSWSRRMSRCLDEIEIPALRRGAPEEG